MNYLYILKNNKNERYYIGSTNNLDRRLTEHNGGKTKSLKNLLPVNLVFKKEFNNIIDARKIELKLKKYKNRNIIENIISGKYKI